MRTLSRWFGLWLAAILVVSLAGAAALPASAAEKSLVWERFDVDLQVNLDGTFDVAEHQSIRFLDGTFTFGYRDIPKRHLAFLSDWSVVDAAGNRYTQAEGGRVPYTFVVDDVGSSYTIRWYFPETDQPQRYTLRYRVHDGLRYYAGGDQLWWKAVFADRQFPVAASRVRVVVPSPATIEQWGAYLGTAEAGDDVLSRLLDSNRVALFESQRSLSAGEELEVRVQFTAGVVAGSAPAWQAAADAEAAQVEAEEAFRERWGPVATVALGVLGVALLLGGPVLVYLMWYRFGRDKPVERVADYLPEPPDELAPGLAGLLLDDSADMQDVIATLVDLARRKVLSITEVHEAGFFRTGTDFVYRREGKEERLAGFEQQLLAALFGVGEEKKLSQLKNHFYRDLPGIKQAMYAEMVSRGYYPTAPDSVRTLFGVVGGAAMLLALLVAFGLSTWLFELTPAAICPGIGLFVVAVAILVASRAMPRKTERGAVAAARWKGFKEYLRNIDRYADLEAQKALWDRWLPYAIAFGVDKEYIRKFEGASAPAPGWYIPSPDLYGPYRRRYFGGGLPGGGEGGGEEKGGTLGGGLGEASRGMGGGLASMSAGLGALLSSTGSTLTSRPSGGGGGGGWSGGGGGGGGGGFG